MIAKLVSEAVVVALVVCEAVLAERFGLLRAENRGWQTCLCFAVSGALLLMSVDLLAFGFAAVLTVAGLLLIAMGAMGGAVSGVVYTVVERRSR